MPTSKITFGAGSNLDVDGMAVGDGQSVAFYNCYLDRSGSCRRFPGLTEEFDLNIGNYKVYSYYSKLHDALLIVCGGRVWGLLKGATPVEMTGSHLGVNVKPSFAEDGNTIFIAAASPIHYIDGTYNLSLLAGNSPQQCRTVVYAGGYLLANGNELAGDTTYSDDQANNYTTWQVYNNGTSPDILKVLMVLNNQYVYNIGAESIEVTYQSGDANNPWALNPGRIMSFGTTSEFSVVYDGQDIFMLSEVTGARKVLNFPAGGSPTIISFPIDLSIESFANVSNAEGYVMSFKGQNFYCLHFPTANAVVNDQYYTDITLAYHLQAQAWYILAKWDTTQGVWQAWRGVSFTYAEPWGKQYVGGNDGKLYSFYIPASRQAIITDYVLDTMGDIILDAIGDPLSGVEFPYELTKILEHRWRDDGRKEWGLPRAISLGAIGDYRRSLEQRQCGIYHSRQHELSYTDFTDAGELFKFSLLTGNVTQGTMSRGKRTHRYTYNVKRGSNDLIIDKTGIEEDFEYMRR